MEKDPNRDTKKSNAQVRRAGLCGVRREAGVGWVPAAVTPVVQEEAQGACRLGQHKTPLNAMPPRPGAVFVCLYPPAHVNQDESITKWKLLRSKNTMLQYKHYQNHPVISKKILRIWCSGTEAYT